MTLLARAAAGGAVLLLVSGACAPRRARPRLARDAGCAGSTGYQAGFGRADITGPIAEVGMMGYGKPDQTTAGLHLRLHSRAFVIASPCSGQRVALAVADLGQMFQAVREEVVARLARRFPGVYHRGNVLLAATHTHSGPGGYAHSRFYNITTFGHHRRNFEAIVAGVEASIVQAHADALRPGAGTLRLASGPVDDASANRSPLAYLQNPAQERRRHAHDVDREMVLLRLDRAGGPSAVLNWFAVHPTSMSNANRLVSGDNKGYAAQLLEGGACADVAAPAVAAFAQSNAGDVTPNVYGGADGRGGDELAATERNARAQLAAACRLYRDAASAAPLDARLDARQAYVKMDAVDLGGGRRTCSAAIGLSMLAGAEDGPGLPLLREGMTCRSLGPAGLGFDCRLDGTSGCHGPKPLPALLKTGAHHPPWTPNVLPLQVVRMGSLAIVAVPFEVTTMAGRRLRATALQELEAAGVRVVVLSALANAYAGYVATAEEYALQHYEGASTHFGPHTLAALQQEVGRLSRALAAGTPVHPGPAPPALDPGAVIDPLPLFDAAPPLTPMGAVRRQPQPRYQVGETVTAEFWGGHPSRDFRNGGATFLAVEREGPPGRWTVVARDATWDTRLRWQVALCGSVPCPPGSAASLFTVHWAIPAAAGAGRYRITHHGRHRPPGGSDEEYGGATRTFEVVP